MKWTLFVSENWNSHIVKVNDLSVVVWEVANDVNSFLGYVTETLLNDCNYLYRSPSKENDLWKHSAPENVQTVSID